MDAGGVRSWIRGSVLGAGSFASVSLAVDSDTGELFAVKSARKAGSLEAEALENELRILQSISSPRIVRCLGSCWSASAETGERVRNVFLEYMPGGSVSDLMVKLGGRIHERLARVYTRGILEGLHFLHQRGIVHCDVKGKNVLVGSAGVKLADFGSARDDGSSVDQRSCLSAKGTPLWMAPEVVRQEEQGTPSDIWSLGCTVLEMVTGKAPWSPVSSDTFAALYRIGCTDELPDMPPASVLSEQGRDFVAKCLERDPSKRWSSSQLLEHPFVTEPLVEESSDDDETLTQQQQNRKLELPKLEVGLPVAGDSSTNSPAGSPATVGKWIVVRSPSGSAPDPFSLLSDFEDQGSTDEEAQRQEEPPAPAAAPASSTADDEAAQVLRFPQAEEAEESSVSSSCSSCFWSPPSWSSNGDDASSFAMPPSDRFRAWPGGGEGGAGGIDLWVRQLSKLGSSWVHLKHRLLWRMLERQRLETLTAHCKKGRVEAVGTDSSSSQDAVSLFLLFLCPANVTNVPFHDKASLLAQSAEFKASFHQSRSPDSPNSAAATFSFAWLSFSPTHACTLRLGAAVTVHCDGQSFAFTQQRASQSEPISHGSSFFRLGCFFFLP